MALLSELTKNKPLLIKNGNSLAVNIISDESFGLEQTYKTTVHKTVGDKDIFEYIGKGDEKLKVKFYFELQDDYQDFIDFIDGGQSLLLSCSFFPLVPLKIEGSIQREKYYTGWCIATVSFTTAVDPSLNELGLLNYAAGVLANTSETPYAKKDALASLFNFGKKTFDTVSKGNEFVGAVTNNISAYSSAITNVLSGLASGSSIITNPISSVKSSVSQIIGGLSSVISAMQDVKNAIAQLPNDLDNLLDTFSQLGDQLNDLFDLGDNNENLKYNTTFLEQVSDALLTIDISTDNLAIVNSEENYTASENFLSSLVDKTNEVLSVLALSSILLNLYENSEKINKWNALDLERLRKKTEAIYAYLISFDLSSDLRLNLDLARNSFFNIFKILYANAYNVVEVEVNEPETIYNIVYSINGNLDFLNETKQLNNIVGSIVDNKTIMVISND